MNILIIGSGAREHAIAAALHRSAQRPKIHCCASNLNPGIAQMAVHYWTGDIDDIAEVTRIAKEWQISLAIIGPEDPLQLGLSDSLWQAAIPTIGPRQQLAQIETSKAFARSLMKKYDIPGLPEHKHFTNANGLVEYIKSLGEDNYVVKANGLMGGKGVKVAGDHLHSFGDAAEFCHEILTLQQSVVIEEKLVGQEFSYMGFCDGEHIYPMPIVQDHKRAFVGDKGPNTGGMGSYSDADHSLPFLSKKDVLAAWKINKAVYKALMKEMNDKYIGILYGSFIATKKGVYVIEFNARFGDPEALNVLTILESDFVSLCQAMVTGNLKGSQVKFANQATVCKYAVPKGYPEKSLQNMPIDVSAVKNKSNLYLSGVNAIDGKIYTTGSRAAAYVGVADSIPHAEEIAEKEIRAIDGELFHREDIGTEKLIQQRVDAMRRLRKK